MKFIFAVLDIQTEGRKYVIIKNHLRCTKMQYNQRPEEQKSSEKDNFVCVALHL